MNVPHPWDLPIAKHEAKFMMNQTYVNHKAHEWESSYAYFSIVGGFSHLKVGIISLPPFKNRHNMPSISRREIHGYKVPSTYITNFLPMFYNNTIDKGLYLV